MSHLRNKSYVYSLFCRCGDLYLTRERQYRLKNKLKQKYKDEKFDKQGQTMIYEALHRKLKIEQYEPDYKVGELRCSRMVSLIN